MLDSLKLNIGAWLEYFDEEKNAIQELNSYGVLGYHIDSLARIFSTIRSVGLRIEDVSFLEVGTSDKIGELYVDWNRKEPFSGLHTSNVANFFALNRDKFDYFGIDPLIDDDVIEKYPGLFSPYIKPLKEKAQKILTEGRVPVIFSNLVVGYYNKRFDAEEEKSITGFGSNPKFWDIPSLQIHQYLLRDLVSREANIDSYNKTDYITDLTTPILALNGVEYSNNVKQLMQNAYSLAVPIISGKTGAEERSNSISVWVNN